MVSPPDVTWVCLVYRVPREPSTPRIAVWRRLRALGVAQLGDGVVALPEDPRTREHLEWVADRVLGAGGTALLLQARTLTRHDERELARTMARARAQEYRDLAREADVAARTGLVAGDATRTATRLRRALRAVQRRDYFPPPERDEAVRAVREAVDLLREPVTPAAARSTPGAGGPA
ncbi:hypothetical protein GCM10009737_13260 [Nocardioides lentus]|uniref:ChrB N-terminal domain-containing protein n=1 Tax=Nocardioides lentus TaxID=338077 RepID=A0ABP5AH31_9ACTN